jgi:hypothetical protein
MRASAPVAFKCMNVLPDIPGAQVTAYPCPTPPHVSSILFVTDSWLSLQLSKCRTGIRCVVRDLELAHMKGMWRFPEAVSRDPAIDAWLKEQAPGLGAIARTWFTRMRECGSDVRELMHDGCPTACVRDAPFGYVAVFRAHVNVGFFYGAELPDPMGLLVGSGKRMRHVKVRPGVDLDSEGLDALIAAAYADIKERLAVDRSNAST